MSLNRQTQTVAMACPHCFSCNITRDATATWDVDAQQWIHGDTQDHMSCSVCDTEFYEASERAVNATMLNNRAHHAEPDWSAFLNFEISPCRTDIQWDGRGSTFTWACEAFEAEFWTVYGRLKKGGVEAITDTSTVKLALQIAQRLKEVSGVEGETRVFA